MDEKRVYEIAAEFIPFLKGDNDGIAADPRRWHEEMTSWSAEEASCVVAALIHKAVNEALEDAAKRFDAMPVNAIYEAKEAAAAVRSLILPPPQHSTRTEDK